MTTATSPPSPSPGGPETGPGEAFIGPLPLPSPDNIAEQLAYAAEMHRRAPGEGAFGVKPRVQIQDQPNVQPEPEMGPPTPEELKLAHQREAAQKLKDGSWYTEHVMNVAARHNAERRAAEPRPESVEEPAPTAAQPHARTHTTAGGPQTGTKDGRRIVTLGGRQANPSGPEQSQTHMPLERVVARDVDDLRKLGMTDEDIKAQLTDEYRSDLNKDEESIGQKVDALRMHDFDEPYDDEDIALDDADNPETPLSPEQQAQRHEQLVRDATEQAIAVFSTFFDGSHTPDEHKIRAERGSFTHVFTDRQVLKQLQDYAYGKWVGFIPQARDNQSILEDIAEYFDQERITEAVFVSAELPVTFGKFSPESEYRDDPVVVLRYQTALKQYGKYPYAGGGRSGNFMKAQICLPKTVADQLSQEIQRDPGTIRELVDSIMRVRIHAGADWDDTRPPYETWSAINGGTNRMMYDSAGLDGSVEPILLEWHDQVAAEQTTAEQTIERDIAELKSRGDLEDREIIARLLDKYQNDDTLDEYAFYDMLTALYKTDLYQESARMSPEREVAVDIDILRSMGMADNDIVAQLSDEYANSRGLNDQTYARMMDVLRAYDFDAEDTAE